IVAVATPSDHVEGYARGSEKYVTLVEDVIASKVFPVNHLAPNSNNPSCAQVPEFLRAQFCHDFVDAYLNNEDSRAIVMVYVASLIRDKVANRLPVAGFTMTSGTQSATEGQTLTVSISQGQLANISFSASRSSDPDGTVAGWAWNIDGLANASTSATFTYLFAGGSHSVSLVVTDNLGAKSVA